MENTKCGDLIRYHLTNHNAIMFYVCNTVCNKKISNNCCSDQQVAIFVKNGGFEKSH